MRNWDDNQNDLLDMNNNNEGEVEKASKGFEGIIATKKTSDGSVEIDEEVQDEKLQHYFIDQLHQGDRPRWTKWWFTPAAMIAFAVHTSAVSSFPAKVAKNGGLAFVIMYTIAVVVFAFPFLYLEAIVGQYFQTSMLGIWGLCPLFRGVGAEIFIGTFLFVAYFPAAILWNVLMFFEATRSLKNGTIPWATCDNDWNTCQCKHIDNPVCDEQLNGTRGEQNPALEYFLSIVLKMWKSKVEDPKIIKSIAENGNWSIAYSFDNSSEGLGPIILSYGLLMCALFAFICGMTLAKLKYTGYFCTFTVTFPLLALVFLFCRVFTLDGSMDGMRAYMSPDFSRFIDPKAWFIAVESALFSVGAGYGGHISIASFNRIHHNIFRDSWICVIVDTVTSVLSSVVLFMLLGHAYKVQRKPVPKYPNGELFEFTVFAEAITYVTGSTFFASIFYLMVILFSIDTCVIVLRMLFQALYDEYKRKFPDQEVHGRQFLFACVGFSFATALFFIIRGGFWVFLFFDRYAFGVSALTVLFFESLLYSWIWGIEDLSHCTQVITGQRPSLLLRICWKYICPVAIMVIVSFSGITQFSYSPTEAFGIALPERSFVLGCTLEALPLLVIIGYGVYMIIRIRRKSDSFLQLVILLISPEYEHENIKLNMHQTKRLSWAHYVFLRFPDEIDNSPLNIKIQRWTQQLKDLLPMLRSKTRRGFSLGHHLHHHHHHHHQQQQQQPRLHHHHAGQVADQGPESMWEVIGRANRGSTTDDTDTTATEDQQDASSIVSEEASRQSLTVPTTNIAIDNQHSILIGGKQYQEEHHMSVPETSSTPKPVEKKGTVKRKPMPRIKNNKIKPKK